jgi:hypothetical protein
MHKYKVANIPVAQKTLIHSEGKQAFTKGEHRGYNPYSSNNLTLAAIWWNGWDTGEEEREAGKKPQNAAVVKVLHMPLKDKS